MILSAFERHSKESWKIISKILTRGKDKHLLLGPSRRIAVARVENVKERRAESSIKKNVIKRGKNVLSFWDVFASVVDRQCWMCRIKKKKKVKEEVKNWSPRRHWKQTAREARRRGWRSCWRSSIMRSRMAPLQFQVFIFSVQTPEIKIKINVKYNFSSLWSLFWTLCFLYARCFILHCYTKSGKLWIRHHQKKKNCEWIF